MPKLPKKSENLFPFKSLIPKEGIRSVLSVNKTCWICLLLILVLAYLVATVTFLYSKKINLPDSNFQQIVQGKQKIKSPDNKNTDNKNITLPVSDKRKQ